MKVANLLIQGMTCHHCVMAVTEALKSLGIIKYHVQIGQASIVFNEHELDPETIKSAIEEEGYTLKEFVITDEEYIEGEDKSYFKPEIE